MSNPSTTPDFHPLLPKEFVDAHHHFLDTGNNAFQSFLGSLAPNTSYLPSEYQDDVVEPLQKAGVTTIGSVHIECIPDSGVEEALWVESISTESTIKAIVASCDLAQSEHVVNKELASLKEKCSKVVGIRWIVDCVGKFNGEDATHVATKRHDGIDYLRGSNGGYDGEALSAFEKGFALLGNYNLSFDLQCAPIQLPAAARMVAKYPNIPVVIDHLGKPRTLLGDNEATNTNTTPDKAELEVWRTGMKAMAAVPNVYVKISMLGYAVPGWIRNDVRKDLMKSLVRETVSMFGPSRCMVATNWWKAASLSDADGLSDVGPEPIQLLELLVEFLKDYSDEDRRNMFCDTAKKFYKIQ